MSNYDIVIRYREFMKERKESMMNPEHIVARYLMAKESDRKQRLVDLADENHCNVQTIKDILLANGVDENELPHKGRPKKETTKKQTFNPSKFIEEGVKSGTLPQPIIPKALIEPQLGRNTEEKPIEAQEQEVIEEPEVEMEEKPFTFEEVGMKQIVKSNNNTSLLDQMISELEQEAEQLRDEIKKRQDKLDAINNAYIALKELETVTKEVQ